MTSKLLLLCKVYIVKLHLFVAITIAIDHYWNTNNIKQVETDTLGWFVLTNYLLVFGQYMITDFRSRKLNRFGIYFHTKLAS